MGLNKRLIIKYQDSENDVILKGVRVKQFTN